MKRQTVFVCLLCCVLLHISPKLLRKFKRLRISLDVMKKIENKDSHAFEQITENDFKKLTPDIIAAAGANAIRNLSLKKIVLMIEKLFQGNEKSLMIILGALTRQQLDTVITKISEMVNKSGEVFRFNCVQLEPLMMAMKKVYGRPQTWNKELLGKMGKEFVQCLSPDDLKDAAKNKDVYRSLLNNMNKKKRDDRKTSSFKKKSMLKAAKLAFGDIASWKSEDLKSARSLLTFLQPKDLKKLNTGMIKQALEDLGKEQWDEKRGKELLNKLKSSTSGYGALKKWTANTVKKLGNLRASLSIKELDELSNDTLRNSIKEFGQTLLPPYKKRALGKRVKKLYGHPRQWTEEQIKNASGLLAGIESAGLNDINNDALIKALPEIKDVDFPSHKGRILAKKLQQKMGDVNKWNVSIVKQMGGLVRDLPSSTLEKLNSRQAEEAILVLRTKHNIPRSKKRLLAEKLMKSNNSRISYKDLGEIVTEIPIRKLHNIKNITDIIPGDEFFENSTIDDNNTDTVQPSWQAVQARAILGKIIMKTENWGPVSETSENWELKNIKRLKRLVLGLKRTDIDKLNIDSFTDFTSEFSQIFDWTLGQAETIAKRLIKAYESRESEMTVTDMASLGDFLINVFEKIYDSTPLETAKEAVQIVGSSRLLPRLTKSAQKTKAELALKILGKQPSTMTSEDLQEIGYLMGGLTSEQISEIASEAFREAMTALGDLDKLDSNTTIALASKTLAVYGGASSLTDDVLYYMGHIVKGLSSADIANIPSSVLQNNLHVFAESSLSVDQALAVAQKVAGAKRKRRSLDVSSKTAAELIAMGATLLAIAPDQIAMISSAIFLDAVAEISRIQGFSMAQLQAWAAKATSAMGAPAQMIEDHLLVLNEFAKGFTADELGQISFTSNEVIESFGRVRGYDSTQINKMWKAVKGGRSMSSFNGTDLAVLGVIAYGMTTAELSTVELTAYQDAALELGRLDKWSLEKLLILKEKAIQSFGTVRTWTPAEMSVVGSVIGSFNALEIKNISKDQLDAIAASHIKLIPPNVFKEFSTSQLQYFNAEQIAAITMEQKAALSTSQRNIITETEDEEEKTNSGCNGLLGISLTFPTLIHELFFQRV